METYFLSSVAEQDIDEIISYISNENPSAALKFLDELYEAMSILSKNPKIGHEREDLTNKSVRFWPFRRHYLIIYVDHSPIEIVRVLSSYRDISSLLV